MVETKAGHPGEMFLAFQKLLQGKTETSISLLLMAVERWYWDNLRRVMTKHQVSGYPV